MAFVRSLFFASLVGLGASVSLRASTMHKTSVPVVHSPANSIKSPGAPAAEPANGTAEVVALRAKLSKVAASLSVLLDPRGALAKSEVADSMASFVAQLKAVLNETAGMNNTKAALKKLHDAQAGIHRLTESMTQQQQRLAQEGAEQQQSLLLGVLLTKQREPMEKQREILLAPDFARLPVVAAVLRANDTKTPLFQQVAGYLDKHPSKASKASALFPDKLKVGKDGKPDMSAFISSLNAQLLHMQANAKRMLQLHENVMKQLETAVQKEQQKNDMRATKHVQRMMKAESRKYAKEAAVAKKSADSLRAAIGAIQRGDIVKCQAALAASMQALKASAGNFLYLIQIAHRAEGLDCPYCAAQCVDKCHQAGKPYVACLTDCADAGK